MIKNVILLILVSFALTFYAYSKPADNFKEGEKAMGRMDFKKAVDEFSKVIEAQKNNTKAYFQRGMAYLYLNDFDKAILDFNEVIKNEPKHADAYNSRGLCYNYAGDMIKAIFDFDKALEIDPKFSQAYINRAAVFVSRTDYKNAEADLNQAIKLTPDNPEIYLQRGRLNYLKDKFDDAVKDYTKAISLGLDNPKVYYNRANAYFKDGKIKESIADYSKSIELNPNDLETLNNRAYAYKVSGLDSLASLDRKKIDEIKGGYFTPIDSLNFTEFSNKNKDIFLELPDNWKMTEISDSTEMIQFIISPEKIESDNDAVMVGVTVNIMKNMSSKFGVKNETEILDFWKGSLDESNKNLLRYDVVWQRHNQWNGHSTILNQSYLKAGENYMPFLLFEYAIAWGDNLIFMYLQAPEFAFDYYKKIYERTINSIKLGSNYKME